MKNKHDKAYLQSLIDACPEGGAVAVPEGIWESGPLHLKSNMTLQLEAGSVIRFSRRFEDYLPVVFTRWEGVECYNYSPFIYAKDCENITITGPGCLDGQGDAWWHWKKLQQKAADRLIHAESQGIAPEERVFGTEEDALRPSFIQFIGCKGIRLEGFTVKNGPQWTVHPVYCSDVTVRGICVETGGPNTDGLNPDSCSHVLIEDCTFTTGDDCIAINSGTNEDGWRVNRPCEDIEVRNCMFKGGHAAIAIGSGMSGGVRNVRIHDCQICGTDRGIRVKSIRGRGGYVRDVVFERISMSGIQDDAIQVSMNYGSSTSVPVSQKAPEFSRLTFRDISCTDAGRGLDLCGLPESPVRELVMERVDVKGKEADSVSCVE
ncbi:MAG: glycoside hydrolase family 28 protein [Eubacteriales bacterium]|nr:glycoside hydrolase family 28 protein [Eubacteriales bacterium]